MSLARYAAVVMGTVAVTLSLAWPMLPAERPEVRWAAFTGALLAAANTMAAFLLVRFSQPRSTNVFLGAVLGGMVARMGVMLAAVVLAVLQFGLPKVPLAVSLLAYFVVFLVLELTVVNRVTTQTPAEAR